MGYGSTIYAGSSSKAAPLILGLGFAAAAWFSYQGGRTVLHSDVQGPFSRKQLSTALNVVALGLGAGAVLYGSGMGRLIGKPQELSDDQVQLLALVPVPQLPPGEGVAA